MNPRQSVFVSLSATAIACGTLIGSIGPAQACYLQDSSLSFSNPTDQFLHLFKSNAIGKSAVGVALLGILAAGGLYWSRRSRQADVMTEANHEVAELPLTPAAEQVSEQEPVKELVSSRSR